MRRAANSFCASSGPVKPATRDLHLQGAAFSTTHSSKLVDNRRNDCRNFPFGNGAAHMPLLKRSAGAAFVAPLMMFIASCQQPPPPPPPLPPLTESCKFTNTPVVFVPGDRAVEGISAGRRGTEPSLVSVAVRIGDDFRQDGTMYVPGPDLATTPISSIIRSTSCKTETTMHGSV